MRFHASFADSCIGTRKRWGIDQGREMLRNGCGKVNRATNRVTVLLTAGKCCVRKDGSLLSPCTRGGGAARRRCVSATLSRRVRALLVGTEVHGAGGVDGAPFGRCSRRHACVERPPAGEIVPSTDATCGSAVAPRAPVDRGHAEQRVATLGGRYGARGTPPLRAGARRIFGSPARPLARSPARPLARSPARPS